MRTVKQVSTWRRSLRPMVVLVLLLLNILVLAFLSCSKARAADPAVTVTEFSDFQCPYCQRAAVVVEQLRQTYGDNVKFVFKQMPLPMHQYGFKAAEAAVIAQQQGKFWEYHDRLFSASDLSVDALKAMAAEVGLKPDDFSQALDSPATRAAVEKDVQEARQLGVRGTPTFFVNGKVVTGAATIARLTRAIDSARTKPAAETQGLRQTLAANDGSSCENSSSLRFGGAQPIRMEMQDLNGKPDLILTFDQATLKLNPGTKPAFLSGWLRNSQEIVAEGTVNSAE